MRNLNVSYSALICPMKILMVILVLAAMAGTLPAQQTDYAFTNHPHIEIDYAFAEHPRLTREDLAASRFWTQSTIALVALDGAAKAADSYMTRKNIQDGGTEHDPIARPFVHTTPVQVAATGALFGSEIAAAYLLHKKHHDRMARAILIGGAMMNGLGAATSFEHRAPDR